MATVQLCIDHPRAEGGGVTFTRFYAEQLPRLIRFLVSAGVPQGDAIDAAQEAFIAAYARWGEIQQPSAWIRTVARRAALRSRTSVMEEPVGGTEELARIGRAPSCSSTNEASLFYVLLGALPSTQRLVMAWIIDGYSIDEVARALSIKPSSVRSNLRHARLRLGRAYEKYESEEAV